MIGRYAAENGPTHTSKHFLKLLSKNISKPTARREQVVTKTEGVIE